MAGEAAPNAQILGIQVAAAAAAADASGLAVAPVAGTVTAASLVPLTVLTGANTNSRTVNVFNRGQTGAGTTVIASTAFVAGVNAPALDETPLTLSVVAGATTVAAGDVIEVQSLHILTGIAGPQALVRLTVSRVEGA